MTVFCKIDLICTNTEDEKALSRDTKCLRLDGLQAAFSNAVKPQGCIYGLCGP